MAFGEFNANSNPYEPIAPFASSPSTTTARPWFEATPKASLVPSGEKAGQTFRVVPPWRPAINLGSPPSRTR